MSTRAPVDPAGVSITGHFGVRQVRVERHLAVGCLALVVSVILLDHVGSPVGFLALVVAAGTAVRSFARAVDAGFGQFYGWVYGEPKMATIVDRVAYRIIHRHPHAEHRMPDSVGPLLDLPSPGSIQIDQPRVRILAAAVDESDRS